MHGYRNGANLTRQVYSREDSLLHSPAAICEKSSRTKAPENKNRRNPGLENQEHLPA